MNKILIAVVIVGVVAGAGYFLVKSTTRNAPAVERSNNLPSRDTSSQGTSLPTRGQVSPGSTSSGSAPKASQTTTSKPSQATTQDVSAKLNALDSASSDFSSSNSSMNQIDDSTQL